MGAKDGVRSIGYPAELPSSHVVYVVNWSAVCFIIYFLFCHLLIILAYYNTVINWLRTIMTWYFDRYKIKKNSFDSLDALSMMKRAAEQGIQLLSEEDLPGNSVLLYFADQRDRELQRIRLQGGPHPDGPTALPDQSIVYSRLEQNTLRHAQRLRQKMELESTAVRRMNWKRWADKRLKAADDLRHVFTDPQLKLLYPQRTVQKDLNVDADVDVEVLNDMKELTASAKARFDTKDAGRTGISSKKSSDAKDPGIISSGISNKTNTPSEIKTMSKKNPPRKKKSEAMSGRKDKKSSKKSSRKRASSKNKKN